MHGIIKPQNSDLGSRPSVFTALKAWCRRNRPFLAIVVAPTLLATFYYALVASDQYQSEAHFVVRTADVTPTATSGFGQFLGMSAGISSARSDALSVNDYLTSSNAMLELNKAIPLVDVYHNSGGDIVSRLWSSSPTPEDLLKYYRKRVKVHFDNDSGIAVLEVQSFSPQDSYRITRKLLELGEARVNLLNERSLQDTVGNAERQLVEAELALRQGQGRMTSFRQQRGDIDPVGSGRAQIGLVSTLEIELTKAKSELQAMQGLISPRSPQYVAVAARVRALQGQVAAQQGRLTGGGGTIASNLGGYEDLQVRQQFAGKRYGAAAANLAKAREQAAKQQLYIVRVVDPQQAVEAEYPESAKIVATVFFSLLIAYAIGWLIMAGVKEHSL